MILFSHMVLALSDKTTSSVEIYWLSELLHPMITSLSTWKFHYDVDDSKMEVAIIFWNFYSQPGFVLKEVEVVREKGESLKWTCAKRLCRKKAKMSNAVVVFLVCFWFFLKTFVWWKLNITYMQSKKITAEVMFALHINKSCEVESCYLVQECFDRLSDRWWNCAPICFHLWQLTETLRKQPKLEWNTTDHHLE